jgi:glycosyltransferase involved in cell wall biosynthesis
VYPVISHWGWGSWGRVAALVRQWGADIAHIQYQAAAYGMHPAANLLPWQLQQGDHKGRPYIVTTFHDLKVPYLFPKAGPLRWWAMLALMRWSDATILTNEEDHTRIKSIEQRAKNKEQRVSMLYSLCPMLYLVPIGSNMAVAPPPDYDRAAWRARLSVGEGETLLAYFGFLNESKGGETLIRALAELTRRGQPRYITNNKMYRGQPVRLLMVGGQVGDSDPTNVAYLARVKNLIADLGLSERVLWTGFTSAAEVSAHLLAADIGVLPYRDGASFRRGSFMALLAHGLPIVSTVPARAGDARSLDSGLPRLRDGENVRLVPPDDPAALAQAIAELIASPEARQRLAAGARALAAAFAWEGIARRHLEVYQKLLAARTTGTPSP